MRLARSAKFLAPAILALASLGLQAQTTVPQTATPPPGNVPVTSQTPAAGETNPVTASPKTKREMKEEKKEKKKEKAEKKSKREARKEKKEAKERADTSLPPA